MPNKADKNKPKEAEEPQPQPHAPASVYAVLFQMEDVAVNGRKIAYDILKKTLGEQKIDFPIPVFSRYCVNSTPQTYLPAMMEPLGIRKVSAEKLVENVTSAIAEQASASSVKLNPGLGKILQARPRAQLRDRRHQHVDGGNRPGAPRKAGIERARRAALLVQRREQGVPQRRYLAEDGQGHQYQSAPMPRGRRKHGGVQIRDIGRSAVPRRA